MPATVTRYPIDPDLYSKGDYIAPESLLQCCHPAVPGTRQWSQKLMGVGSFLRKALTLRYGSEVTIRYEKDGLRILTDSESSAYNSDRVDDGVRLIRRATRRLGAVEIANLTPEEKRLHDRRVLRATMTLTGAVNERRRFLSVVDSHENGKLSGAKQK